MKKCYCLFFIVFVFCCYNNKIFAQYNKDSLVSVWKNSSLPDSLRLKALSDISGYIYLYTNPDTSFLYADTLELYAKKVNNKKQIANALNLKGISFVIRGNYFLAIDYFNESLKISEELKDNNGIANSTNSLGIIYQKQSNYQKSLEYFTKCLEIREAMKDTVGMANSLSNIGIAQSNLGLKDEALFSYLKSIDYRKKINDKNGIANSYANIGNIYIDNNKMELALESFLKSLALYKEIKNLFGMGAMYVSIAKLFLNTNLKLAYAYADSAKNIAEKTNIIQLLSETSETLYKIYKQNGDYKNALLNYEKYISYKDSIENDKNQKQLLQKQFEFEYERKETALKAEQEKKDAIAKAEKQRQKLIMYLVGAVAFAIAIIALLVFRSLKMTKKQKQIIEEQKNLVEEKQKEILDSIHYAKRIQMALLTSEYYIEKNLIRLLK
ncbi:MAG: tetratricopeptide repeat protein [Bacteroidia bacterium]